MKLSKAYINKVKKYAEESTRLSGGVFYYNGVLLAHNSVSIIVFSVDGSEEPIKVEDLDGINVKDGSTFVLGKHSPWEYCVRPYWSDPSYYYEEEPYRLTITHLKEVVTDIKKENLVPRNVKLYEQYVSKNKNVACQFGEMWLIPELVLDVAEIVGDKKHDIEMFIPKNKTLPAVIKGTNTYGTHLGFVLGTAKNKRSGNNG